MDSQQTAQFELLALPDASLVAVVRCCAANDQRSLHNMAQAHSRLHQAAVEALGSIKLQVSQPDQGVSALLHCCMASAGK
jgi:hypothetical protein